MKARAKNIVDTKTVNDFIAMILPALKDYAEKFIKTQAQQEKVQKLKADLASLRLTQAKKNKGKKFPTAEEMVREARTRGWA